MSWFLARLCQIYCAQRGCFSYRGYLYNEMGNFALCQLFERFFYLAIILVYTNLSDEVCLKTTFVLLAPMWRDGGSDGYY
jgi:hypothetical protein